MADLPRRRLPASAFAPFSVVDRAPGPEDDPEPVWSEARSMVSESEVFSGDELEESDTSLSEGVSSDGNGGDDSSGDDDSVNTEEEFRRDLEEQRIADEKNGHFVEAQLPAGERLTSSAAATSFVARVFHAHAATSVGEWGSNSMVEDPTLLISEKSADYSAFTPFNLHGKSHVQVVGMEKERIMGVGTDYGGSNLESTLKDVQDVDRSMAADFIIPLSMVRDKDFNASVDSTALDFISNCDNNFSHMDVENQSFMHEDLISEKNGLLGLVESRPLVEKNEMAENPAAKWDHNLLSKNEENNHLDLAEARPLAVQQLGPAPLSGPSYFESKSAAAAQVGINMGSNFSQLNHSPHLSSAQISQPNTQPIFPPGTLFMNPLDTPHQPKKPPRHPKLPLPKSTAHLKNKSSAQISNISPVPQSGSVLTGKDLAASLFSGAAHGELAGKNLLLQSPMAAAFVDEEMAEFPPLKSSVHAQKKKDGSSFSGSCIPAAAAVQTPHAAAPPSSSHPPTDPTSNSWADMMKKNQSREEEVHKESPSVRNEHSETATGGQPNIVFGRSMADVLQSGQPAEGPVFLDREKAEKRGEVRIVEGKPCLFFSANETSILAGRLGPAIVGKFSHSIPPARQIQKALGNLKLVGAMSWNFLNAKHIFIELSDMRDYVKLLNGPNNSPVWYIDHHPMRVFKWTPDFDPFFESPITTAWCNILALPVHLFEESSLIAIGEMLGKPVQVDRATISRSRVSFARICVEIDLSRPIVEEIDINIAGKHVTLKVKWEKIPLYCHECKHVGHSAMTCYASGKRPMPPKRDYSHGPPTQNRPPTSSDGVSRQPNQSLAASFAAGRQHQAPRQQPRSDEASVRPPPEVRQPPRPANRDQEIELGQQPPTSGFYHGSSSTAAEGTHATNDDGFFAPRKKNMTKAQRKRDRRSRRKKQQAIVDAARMMSDGERDPGADPDESSSQSERGSRSLSPLLRHGLGFGPLAMVLHDDNMFGALDDVPSDDNEAGFDELDDGMMVDDSVRRIHFKEPAMQYIGYTSPPQEGTPKRPKTSASAPY